MSSKSIYGKTSVNLTVDSLSFLSLTTNDIETTNATVSATLDANSINCSTLNVSNFFVDSIDVDNVSATNISVDSITGTNGSFTNINSSLDTITGEIIDINSSILDIETTLNNYNTSFSTQILNASSIDTTGNVDIGGDLTVDGALLSIGNINISNGGDTILSLYDNEQNSNGQVRINFNNTRNNEWVLGLQDGDNGKFKICQDDNLAVNNALTIDLSLNVGIGTTNPTEKLDVVGNITCSGVINSSSLNSSTIDDINASLTSLQNQINNIDIENFDLINVSQINISNASCENASFTSISTNTIYGSNGYFSSSLNSSSVNCSIINGYTTSVILATVEQNVSDIDANTIAIANLNTSVSQLDSDITDLETSFTLLETDVDNNTSSINSINTTLNNFNSSFTTVDIYSINISNTSLINSSILKATSLINGQDILTQTNYKMVLQNATTETLLYSDSNNETFGDINNIYFDRLRGNTTGASIHCYNGSFNTLNVSVLNASIQNVEQVNHSISDVQDLNVSDLHCSYMLCDTNASINGNLYIGGDLNCSAYENTISNINSSITNINSSITSLQSQITSNDTDISNLNSSVSQLDTQFTSLAGSVLQNTGDITSIEGILSDYNVSFSTSQLNSSSFNTSSINTSTLYSITNNVSTGNISTLNTSVIFLNGNNIASSFSCADLEGTNLTLGSMYLNNNTTDVYGNGTSNILRYFTSNQAAADTFIMRFNGRADIGYDGTNQEFNLKTYSNKNITLTPNGTGQVYISSNLNVSSINSSTIDTINTSLVDLQNQIDSIDITDFSLINVSQLNASNINSSTIDTINNDITIIEGDITTIQGDITTIEGDITTINTTINNFNSSFNSSLINVSILNCSEMNVETTNHLVSDVEDLNVSDFHCSFMLCDTNASITGNLNVSGNITGTTISNINTSLVDLQNQISTGSTTFNTQLINVSTTNTSELNASTINSSTIDTINNILTNYNTSFNSSLINVSNANISNLVVDDITSGAILISENSQNETDCGLIIKPISLGGQDSYLQIRGARDGSTAAKNANLLLCNYDNDNVGDETHIIGRISGRVTNATTNYGVMSFYSNDGTEVEELQVRPDVVEVFNELKCNNITGTTITNINSSISTNTNNITEINSSIDDINTELSTIQSSLLNLDNLSITTYALNASSAHINGNASFEGNVSVGTNLIVVGVSNLYDDLEMTTGTSINLLNNNNLNITSGNVSLTNTPFITNKNITCNASVNCSNASVNGNVYCEDFFVERINYNVSFLNPFMFNNFVLQYNNNTIANGNWGRGNLIKKTTAGGKLYTNGFQFIEYNSANDGTFIIGGDIPAYATDHMYKVEAQVVYKNLTSSRQIPVIAISKINPITGIPDTSRQAGTNTAWDYFGNNYGSGDALYGEDNGCAHNTRFTEIKYTTLKHTRYLTMGFFDKVGIATYMSTGSNNDFSQLVTNFDLEYATIKFTYVGDYAFTSSTF